MGDFDRVQSNGQKNETKKMALMILLGVILAGVLVFHFAKQGPQSVDAATPAVSANPAEPAPTQTPDAVLSVLQGEDPTDKLLLNNATDDPAFSKVPRNPFRMSSTWLTSLIKPKELPPAPKHVDIVQSPTTPHAPLVPLKLEDYKLNMIFQKGGKLMALVNGKEVTAGRIVDKARVLEITDNSVTLQNTESPDAPNIILSTEKYK